MARVLVTRHEPEAAQTASRLREVGHSPLVSPVRVVELLTPLLPEGPFGAIVLTSRNALPALAGAVEAWRNTPVHCVGDRTAEAARALGFADVVSAKGDARTLLALLAHELPPRARVLYMAGEPRRPALEEGLAACGYLAQTCLAYRMRRADRLSEEALAVLRARALDAVLHFSAESARDFLALATDAGLRAEALESRHLCLSAAVGAVIRDAGASPADVRVAPAPDSDSLLALLPPHGTP